MVKALPPIPPDFPDAAEALRRHAHIDPHLPIHLQSVPDDGHKPTLITATLIKLAIYSDKAKMLTLQQILDALADRFEWYRRHRHEVQWKNNVRHTLTMYKTFVPLDRLPSDRGTGSYWTFDEREGYARIPRR
ncbi:hypothetical protein C8R43DRAFT_883388 [Mycena crocata]|nr:hypothetical protein C8R43DRAFT_883388 [Mycena crocata]